MKPPPFLYRPAHSIEQALDLLAEYGDDAKILAGGQSLVPMLAMRLARPDVLIDINTVPGLTNASSQQWLTLGAMIRHRTAERSEMVWEHSPMLAAALRFVGHDAIRTRGTLGGSAAHGDPAAELPTVLCALNASIVATRAGGERSVDAEAFFEGFLTTALKPDELLTAIKIPPCLESTGWAFNEVSRRHDDFAVVGAAVLLSLTESGGVEDVRIFLSGVADRPMRATVTEALVRSERPGVESFAKAAQAATDGIEPTSDLRGSGAYRAHLARVLVRRGLNEAFERAGRNR